MKKTFRGLMSVLLVVSIILGTVIAASSSIPVGLSVEANAVGGNYYMINGKSLSYSSVTDPGSGKNDEYVKALYEYVWGEKYTDDIADPNNILKNLPYEKRRLTAENLRNYMQRCEPGTVLRVETVNEVSGLANGRTVFVVSSDSNGFTVFERTDVIAENYYTWDHFCDVYAYSTIRFLKWRNGIFVSDETQSETDYKKPDRVLYYDELSPLYGDDVKWVQQMLNNAGYPINVDGYFGKKAEEVLKNFQGAFSLSKTGVVDSQTADMLEVPVKKPGEIEITLKNVSDSHLSVGDILTVTWEKVDFAESYHILLYNNRGKLIDELDKITGNEASFVIGESGTYIVKGYSVNEKFIGDVCVMSQRIKVHNTFVVEFFDEDGTLLNKQSVAYGLDAVTPASPKKTGCSFVGWDKEYTNVTEPLKINAKYIKKSFTVTFCDGVGNVIGEPQKVLYGESADAPRTSGIDGFVGWNRDFSFIDKSITVKAVVDNDYASLPVSVSNASAVRESESSGYSVYFTVKNTTEQRAVGRAVVSLKTTEGKFLTLTESAAFSLPASSTIGKAMKVFVPYDKAATIAEVYIVENYADLVPISRVVVISNISTANNYTDWTQTPPTTYTAVVGTKTQYRYKQISRTSSAEASLSGWIRYNARQTGTRYSGWSDWTTQYIYPGSARTIETRTESYVTGYNVRHWLTQRSYSPHLRHYWDYNHGPERSTYGQFARDKWVSLSEWNNYYAVAPGALSSGSASGCNKSGQVGRSEASGLLWFAYNTTYGYYNLYRYQDSFPVYTYDYYRWSDWSAWRDTPVTPISGERVVEERVLKRYEVNDPTVCNTGVTRTITGAVDSALAGKEATLFVYKKGEASDYTNEYVGQSVIGQNGIYRFTFKLREEPDVDTGDYYVTLGVEGTNTVFMLDNIKAPVKEYTVNILAWHEADPENNIQADYGVISTQTVKRGESAILPSENPVRPGYTFAGWNYSNASIYEDTDIRALYTQDEYTVVFIDWTNELFEMQTGYKYGDLLAVPMLNPEEAFAVDENGSSVSSGVWQGIPSDMRVTQNMVITAEYTEKEYTVTFWDYNKNEIPITVKYGEAVEPPVLESDGEHTFISWTCEELEDGEELDLACITSDMTVKPVFCFARTTEKPSASVVSGIYNEPLSVTLNSATENSVVFYSLNNSDEYYEYTTPIVIDATTEITFYASSLGYNNSEKVKVYYIVNTASNTAEWKYPVSVYNGDEFIDVYIVPSGAVTDGIVPDFTLEGYDFAGYYTDVALQNAWDGSADAVTDSVSLYASLTPATYTVNFMYEDGTVIDTIDVGYLAAATPPTVTLGVEETFIKWSSDAYCCVTDDMDVYAIVRNSSEIASITLNKTELVMITGMGFGMSAVITPELYSNNTVVWYSSNPSVASVNNEGQVTAVAPGNAIITAMLSGDDVFTAQCTVEVRRNVSENICLVKNSGLTIVGDKLLGVLPDSNTVNAVFAEIDSNELAAYSSVGEQLSGNDRMETGAVIYLSDENGAIIDMIKVVVAGDVYADGYVNNRDATLLMRYKANKQSGLGELALLAADCNADGSPDLRDASMILCYIVGKDSPLA